MVKISPLISESLSEYLILTGEVEVPPEKVSLKTKLGRIHFQYPYMTARMQSVVGPEMAVAAGRNGILPIIPRSLSKEDKIEIIKASNKARLKEGDIEFVEKPLTASPNDTLERVIKQVESTGYSIIPIVDEFRKLYGVYIHNPDNPPSTPRNTEIKNLMIPLLLNKFENKQGIPYLVRNNFRDLSKEEIKEVLKEQERRFIPILDERGILLQIAFMSKFDTNFLGLALSSRREVWKEEIEEYGEFIDSFCIDSSNAFFKDAFDIIKYAKKKYPEKPFGIGNIITKEAFYKFAEEGADYIIGGMGVGSICKTGLERGNGRGQFTVAKELSAARDHFYKKTGRYVYFVLDGGIKDKKDMIVALAFADFIMMGKYFNQFYEAAGRKLDENKEITDDESKIKFVEIWGEGHPRAKLVSLHGINLDKNYQTSLEELNQRYGHYTLSGSTIEGVVGYVPYRGRLKPCVEEDARYLRTTISNVGARDLESFRKKVCLEKASKQTLDEMGPHGIVVKEE